MGISDMPGVGKKHVYIMEFREYVSKESFVPLYKKTECFEDELQGEKERISMEIESCNGNRVECVQITEYQDDCERGTTK